MDITRFMEEEERDLLFLVQEAYGEFEMKPFEWKPEYRDGHTCTAAYYAAAIAWSNEQAAELEKEQALLDEAVARAQALGRPFTEDEALSPAWQAGYELTPEMDSRFVLVQEATKKTRRLWSVVDMAELPF